MFGQDLAGFTTARGNSRRNRQQMRLYHWSFTYEKICQTLSGKSVAQQTPEIFQTLSEKSDMWHRVAAPSISLPPTCAERLSPSASRLHANSIRASVCGASWTSLKYYWLMNDNYRHAQRQLGSLYDARRHIIGNLLPSRRLQKAEERRKEEVDSCRYLTRVIVVDQLALRLWP